VLHHQASQTLLLLLLAAGVYRTARDWLMSAWGLTEDQAITLLTVACDFNVHQVGPAPAAATPRGAAHACSHERQCCCHARLLQAVLVPQSCFRAGSLHWQCLGGLLHNAQYSALTAGATSSNTIISWAATVPGMVQHRMPA
jgi:hypothetical protein